MEPEECLLTILIVAFGSVIENTNIKTYTLAQFWHKKVIVWQGRCLTLYKRKYACKRVIPNSALSHLAFIIAAPASKDDDEGYRDEKVVSLSSAGKV